ncbi:MAG: tyrosine-type recombinase/integrase [Persicimonas sp.]
MPQDTDEKIEGHTGLYRTDDRRLRVLATAKCPKTGQMKRTQRTLDEGATIEDAIKLRQALREKLKTPEQPTIRGPQITTLADFSEKWLARRKKTKKASTVNKEVKVLGRWVLPRLGHVRLDRLTRRDISQWIDWAERQRKDNGDLYARSYVRGWWRVFRNMLKDAWAQGYIAEDLARRQRPPDTGVAKRQEQRTLTLEELHTYLDGVKRIQPQRYAEVCTLAYTGMRPSEMYALTWDRVHLEEGWLDLEWAVWRGNVDTVKTQDPRQPPLHPKLAEILRSHREQQRADELEQLGDDDVVLLHRRRAGREEDDDKPDPRDLVFPSVNGGFRGTSSIHKPMKIVRDHLEFDKNVSPQVLRRTFNTLAVEAGIDRVVLWAMFGHNSEQMTQRYAGVGMETKRAALASLFPTED